MIDTIRMIANIIGHLRLCYQLLKSRVLVSFGMEDPHQPPVIPAKAGIQSDDIAFAKVCGVDSRFRGNDEGAQMPHRTDESWHILLHRAHQSTEVLTGPRESKISTRRMRVLISQF